MSNKSFAMTAAAAALLLGLTACTSTTTIAPSGGSISYEARGGQTVTISTDHLDQALETYVKPLLAEAGGENRVIVVSYTLAPDPEKLDRIIRFVEANLNAGDQFRIERDFIYHEGVAFTIEDVKASGYKWYSAQATSSNYGRATAANLAQQAANPGDLTNPRTLDSPNPQAAVGAVDRYQRGEVRPLGEISLEAGGGKQN